MRGGAMRSVSASSSQSATLRRPEADWTVPTAVTCSGRGGGLQANLESLLFSVFSRGAVKIRTLKRCHVREKKGISRGRTQAKEQTGEK